MENFNPDPKPGRLILPLVLIGMIATTYTFINRVTTNNNLEVVNIVDNNTEEVVSEEITEDSTTTTTTTTLPEDVVTYLEEIQAEKIQSTELGKKVLETNQRWDDKDTTYQEAQQEFEAFINDAEQFVATVSDPGPPNSNASLVSNHEQLKVLVNLIYEDTKELLEGLTAPDTGERRSSALSSFNNNLGSFQQKIEEIISSSTSS
ncbi:hypothetical protein OAU92_02790 [Acidimicrobiia bacterium]|jgi:hypothetical protein|nr:hypothetical protein [Acidimicrobiaceae bacterium]MDB4604279.1 hypothetical protein [Acidimicrobiia bacterium]MDB4833274.1 hypothetical protein [Acidimicrobiia bacterium]MDC3277481.1 hypothetical protein [Acidimicrobiia bacterium]|tara:strand:+ start:3334 stop:3948 length:615 start_codon:yes stop_codon:yes gene_type:complete